VVYGVEVDVRVEGWGEVEREGGGGGGCGGGGGGGGGERGERG